MNIIIVGPKGYFYLLNKTRREIFKKDDVKLSSDDTKFILVNGSRLIAINRSKVGTNG